jgi:Outer membrane lipoprotein-sorting protein
MIKRISIFLMFNLLFFSSFAQELREFSNSEKTEIAKNLLSKSEQILSLQCNFVQEKTSSLVSEKSVSQGILQFKNPEFLRWEYTSPNVISLICNGKDVALINDKGEKRDAKTFRQLGEFITSAINGKGLLDNKNFAVAYFEFDKQFILLRLTPINKRLKAFYEKIEMKIDSNTGLAHEITMCEVSGDKTVITLKNHKANIEILDSKFQF